MTVQEKEKFIANLPDDLKNKYSTNNFDELLSNLNNVISNGDFVIKDENDNIIDNGKDVYDKMLSILIVDTLKSIGAAISYDYEIPFNLKRIFMLLGFRENKNIFITFIKNFIKKNGGDSYQLFNDTNIATLYNLWRDDTLSDSDIKGTSEDKTDSVLFNKNWFAAPVSTLRTFIAETYKELEDKLSDTKVSQALANLKNNSDIPSNLSKYITDNNPLNSFIVRSLILTDGQDMGVDNLRSENDINNILLYIVGKKENKKDSFETTNKKIYDIYTKFKGLTKNDQQELFKNLQELMNGTYNR